ncbi:MAG: DUF362 domain-containing protein [Eubacteriales bacterium]|nr:DUF362 domain-containing protein [Eubacteriales bacterium]
MLQNEILRVYGTDYEKITFKLLEAAELASDIRKKVSGKKDIRIGIKPNLVCPTPADFGATTHPEIVEGIITYLLYNGFEAGSIVIIESSWVGDRTSEAFEYCGYNALSKKYGIALMDMQKEKAVVSSDCAGIGLNICRPALELDYLINVPVLKGHCQTKISCALKNMKGLIPNSEKRRFHRMGLHKPIAHLNIALKQDFIVIDHICGDPDFEEGGSPLIRNCVMAAKDPVLTDAFAAKLLGYEPYEIEYVKLAEKLGIGSADLSGLSLRTVEGEIYDGEPADSSCTLENAGGGNAGEAAKTLRAADPFAGVKAPELRKIVKTACAVDEIDSCSACFGMLVPALERLKDEGKFERLMLKLGGGSICIGQGYKGKSGAVGIGNCTAGFDFCIKGCPPHGEDIYKGLKDFLEA